MNLNILHEHIINFFSQLAGAPINKCLP